MNIKFASRNLSQIVEDCNLYVCENSTANGLVKEFLKRMISRFPHLQHSATCDRGIWGGTLGMYNSVGRSDRRADSRERSTSFGRQSRCGAVNQGVNFENYRARG